MIKSVLKKVRGLLTYFKNVKIILGPNITITLHSFTCIHRYIDIDECMWKNRQMGLNKVSKNAVIDDETYKFVRTVIKWRTLVWIRQNSLFKYSIKNGS